MSFTVLSRFHRSHSPALLVLLALAAVLAFGPFPHPAGPVAAASDSRGCEPRLPLDLAWAAEGSDPALPGAALTLVITARTDLPSVRLELQLPEHAELLSGPEGFQGKLGRGEEKRLRFRVSPNGAAKIGARVTAVTPSGLVFHRGASLELAADGGPPAPGDPGRLVRAPGGGRPVREFPAAAQGGGH